MIKKNMRHGNSIKYFLTIFFIFFQSNLFTEDKISSTPLLNIDEIQPSFEITDEKIENDYNENKIREKNIKNQNLLSSHATLIGLDKITAKSEKIRINLNEVKNFGPLEIKILKCGKVKVNNQINDVAYMQVKDLTKNENDKVFIFNGWTFASNPSLTPFDHAIYDLQLLNCSNA